MSDETRKMLVCVDLETGGLPTPEFTAAEVPILEVGVILADAGTCEVVETYNLVIHQSEDMLNTMNDWCWEQHTKSGLVEEVRASELTLEQAEVLLCAQFDKWIAEYGLEEGREPLCGSSVHFDRDFLKAQMPAFNAKLHYRNLDVSSIKEACKKFDLPIYQHPQDEASHRAIGDLRATLGELAFYKHVYFSGGSDAD
jgi:oligoribonuclease